MYDALRAKLDNFAAMIEKSISEKINTYGGIYYPKEQYIIDFNSNYTALLEENDGVIGDLGSNVGDATFMEGKASTCYLNKYERNAKLRAVTITIKGLTCSVCGFNFREKYGDRGLGFIEVHHIKPFSEHVGIHEVNPYTDMEVLCSNCHRMIHRYRNDTLSIGELKGMII